MNHFQNKDWTENDLATILVDISFEIHTTFGPGCLESVYEEIICYELKLRGLDFIRQKGVPVLWKGIKLDIGFRSDIIVQDKLIVEVKSLEKVAPVHSKILLTYLKLTGIKLGLLINFGEYLIRDGISRVVNKL
jgi:GxxExxY protein